MYSRMNANKLPRSFRAPLPAETDGTRKRVVIVGGGFTVCLKPLSLLGLFFPLTLILTSIR